MNKILSLIGLLVLLLIPSALQAQMFDPVDWSFEVKERDSGKVDLLLTADIDEGWHVYSMNLPGDEGPLPTVFEFEKSKSYSLDGEVQEEEYVTEYDPNFGMDLNYFKDEATWTQTIDRLVAEQFQVKGSLNFMVCNEERCLPPEDVSFTFDIPAGKVGDNPKSANQESEGLTNSLNQGSSNDGNGSTGLLEPVKWEFDKKPMDGNKVKLVFTASIDDKWHLYSQDLESMDGPMPTAFSFEGAQSYKRVGSVEEPKPITKFDPVFEMEVSYFEKEVSFEQVVELTGKKKAEINGEVSYMSCDDERCIFPDPVPFSFTVEQAELTASSTESSSDGDKKTLWGVFIIAFFGGFAALLTPCVFPMIPLTVSFFTKQSKNRAKGVTNAILYGLSIIAIYTLLGFGVTKIFGADALNALSTNVWFNLIFFALLVIFAISFFGAFEIQLPTSWVNKMDRRADQGGLLGIFFMAFTLSLVSFSCTGPIIGTLLVEAAYIGGNSGPLIGMFGFSLALALPFALFAAFPGWLNSLPQSGGWLNSVKVFLGFLELALAFKFLSNADLVVQAGILTREVFIAIWIAVFAALTMYLFGLIRLPHDSKIEKLSVGRSMLATFTLAFTLYLIPGLWGAPLNLISGFPPPMFYSESPNGLTVKVNNLPAQPSGSGGGDVQVASDHGSSATCPHNLNCFHDYETGLKYAKEVDKPVMLDFTGWACVNCRKMEERVWSDSRVLSVLRNDVVLISLYVDDKNELPEEEQKTVTIGDRKKDIETIGNKWSYFQASRFRSNSQPQYVLLDHQEDKLNEPIGYTPDIDKYLDWLNNGIEEFEERQSEMAQR